MLDVKTTDMLFRTKYHSQLGRYDMISSTAGIVYLAPEDDTELISLLVAGNIVTNEENPFNKELIKQLDSYFAGHIFQFDVPLDLRGTPFRQNVWNLLLDIPYGQTRSYLDIARTMGRSEAVRAVGQAVGRNPVSILVPCHRVIGANGSLTGYRGGLERKRALLALEACSLKNNQSITT